MAMNLLLVGRTGNGKSSTGNSILGGKFFKPSSSSQSALVEGVAGTSIVNGVEITVVDGPGIGDCSLEDYEGVKLTIDNVQQAMNLCTNGFSAVLFVLPFGERFTRQETDALVMLKGILGENVLRTHGGIVMTRGDNFDADDNDRMTFEKWCQEQTGDFRNLLNECNFRCVLFNNRSTGETLNGQRNKLLKLLNKVTPYMIDDYKKAERDRERILAYSKRPLLERKNKQVLGKINGTIGQLNITRDPESAIGEISRQQQILQDHKRYLEQEADGTDIAKHALVEVDVLETSLRMKVGIAKAELKLREKKSHIAEKSDEYKKSRYGGYINDSTRQQERSLSSIENDARTNQNDKLRHTWNCVGPTNPAKPRTPQGRDVSTRKQERLNQSGEKPVTAAEMAMKLLLVGRTGNGKSSTGNSILGGKFFKPSFSSQSALVQGVKGTFVVNGVEITVVDGPGIGDCSLEDYEGVKLTIDNVQQAMNLCTNGFSAVLFVLPFGERFTRQETDALAMLKGILGENVLRTHGGILMTRGDNFDADDNDRMTFEKWCQEQTGDFRNLLNECNFRCVLFNNRSTGETLNAQRNKLLKLLNKVTPYMIDDYKKAERDRERILAYSKRPLLERENKQVLGKINGTIGQLNITTDPQSAMTEISRHQQILQNHKRYLEQEADGTDVAKHALVEVDVLETTLRMKLGIANAELKLKEQKNSNNRKSADYMHSKHGRHQDVLIRPQDRSVHSRLNDEFRNPDNDQHNGQTPRGTRRHENQPNRSVLRNTSSLEENPTYRPTTSSIWGEHTPPRSRNITSHEGFKTHSGTKHEALISFDHSPRKKMRCMNCVVM